MSDRRCLITGASRGIGRHIVMALASRFQSMIIVGRDRPALESLREDMKASQVRIACGDVADVGFQQELARMAMEQGGIDLLVNNAGISLFGAFDTQTPETMQRVLDVNLVAPMLLTRALLPALRLTAAPQVINIGSTFADIGYPGFAVYCASKFGLRGLTEALDREFASGGPRVRLFSPRATQTDINPVEVRQLNRDLGVAEDDPREVARMLIEFLDQRDPVRRIGFPERVFVRLNQLAPGLVSRALHRQLPRIRAAFAARGS